MNVRRRLPAALMITLLWGCGPAYQDLKQGAAEAPDVYAYTSEACEGYEAEEGCVRFIGEICEALHTRTAAKAVAQIEADDSSRNGDAAAFDIDLHEFERGTHAFFMWRCGGCQNRLGSCRRSCLVLSRFFGAW